MSGAIDLFFRSLPILIGGGAVQLIIFLLKRRAENRATHAQANHADAEADNFIVQAAREAVGIADQQRDHAVKRATDLEAQVQGLQARLNSVESMLAGVEALRAEVAQLREENATLRTAVEICRRTHPA